VPIGSLISLQDWTIRSDRNRPEKSIIVIKRFTTFDEVPYSRVGNPVSIISSQKFLQVQQKLAAAASASGMHDSFKIHLDTLNVKGKLTWGLLISFL
jgi:hypothetical protein